MGNFSLAIRRMTVATISWFLEGRRVPAFKDNASTRERAVTINAPIMYHWFGEEARTKAKRKFDVRCRYLDGSGPELSHEIILEAKRPILFQSKNWRLSGDAIPGQFYGTLREGDLLLMSFHRETQTLSWLCVRGPGALDRHVPEQELITHGQLLSLLGEAENNMWLPHPDVANEVIRVSAQLYPTAARLLGESYSYKEVCRQLWRQFTDEGFPSQQALEQISLLLMLRRLCALDEQDREVRVWLKDFTTWADIRLGGFTAVQNALSRLPRPFAAVMEGGSLSLRTMRILDETLVLVEMLPLGATDHAQSGEIYSELISYLDTGRSGQYPTPPLVTDLMVSLANPTASDYVLDPVAGTGRLLQEAHRRMCGLSSWRPSSVMEAVLEDPHIRGLDIDSSMVRIGNTNLFLNGILSPVITYADAMTGVRSDRDTLLLADLSWNGRIARPELTSEGPGLDTEASELLLTAQCLRLLKKGGRFVIVVPASLLDREAAEHDRLRRFLVDENQLQAVITLAGGAFAPYTDLPTAILVGTCGGQTKQVWFYASDNIQDSLPVGQITAAFKAFQARVQTEDVAENLPLGWTAVAQELVGQEYILAAHLFAPKSQENRGVSAVLGLLERAQSLEVEITERLNALIGLLRGERP